MQSPHKDNRTKKARLARLKKEADSIKSEIKKILSYIIIDDDDNPYTKKLEELQCLLYEVQAKIDYLSSSR